MRDSNTRSDVMEPPWYRQFWPWFLIALPLSVVIAGFATLGIAIANRDARVGADYRQEGLARIPENAKELAAANSRISAKIEFSGSDGRQPIAAVFVKHNSDVRVSVDTLQLAHPVDAQRDVSLPPSTAQTISGDSAERQFLIGASARDALQQGWWNLTLAGVVSGLDTNSALDGRDSVREMSGQSATAAWHLQFRCWIPRSLTTRCVSDTADRSSPRRLGSG
mgnify:CR=1 FL=1